MVLVVFVPTTAVIDNIQQASDDEREECSCSCDQVLVGAALLARRSAADLSLLARFFDFQVPA